MTQAAKKVQYKPLHSALDFGNCGLAGKLAKTARKQGIADAKPMITAHVPKNIFYRVANPFFENLNLTGLTQYKERRMSRMAYIAETQILGGLSSISAASMIEGNAVSDGQVVGGGCKIAGQRKAEGVVGPALGNPMGRQPAISVEGSDSFSINESVSTFNTAANTNAAPTSIKSPELLDQAQDSTQDQTPLHLEAA